MKDIPQPLNVEMIKASLSALLHQKNVEHFAIVTTNNTGDFAVVHGGNKMLNYGALQFATRITFEQIRDGK